MIRNRYELLEYLSEDSKNYVSVASLGCFDKIKKYIWRLLFTQPSNDQKLIWNYIKALRHAEYAINSGRPIVKIYWLWKLRNLSYKLGYQIPVNVFDKGLTIFHWGSIIVNAKARVGKNCMLQPQITIGQKQDGEAPIIGDNCYIGSGARIIGNITIGDNVTIAPNAIITKSFPSNCVLGGVNKILKYKEKL
ncbi:serine acetyltransferase [Segatella copri]|uniref:serine acetyltransferase n=1 Tax=Segatella copri TaxID=165179 RepID=UPI002FEF5FEC